MKIIDIFDAVKDGTFDDFRRLYNNDVNIIDKYTNLNLLQTALINKDNLDDKIKIIEFLISEHIDINYIGGKHQRNALHIFYFNVKKISIDYLIIITKLLLENGIDVNRVDEFNAVPLKYLITLNKLKDDELKELYLLLIKSGTNYMHKDNFNKSCIDYAKEYSWRNGFVDIVEEFQNEIK